MKLYVEKFLGGRPKSLIGPFNNLGEANTFIDRALVEEERCRVARYGSEDSQGWSNVYYRVSEGRPQ